MTNDSLSMIVLLQLRTEFQHTFMIKWEIKISTIAPHPTKNGVTSCPPLLEIYNRNRAATQIKRHTVSKSALSNYDSDVSTKVPCKKEARTGFLPESKQQGKENPKNKFLRFTS